MIGSINDLRNENGCDGLILRQNLQESSNERAYYLNKNNVFSHHGFVDTIREYQSKGFVGENLAQHFTGEDADEKIVEAWMDSPTHKDILLNCRFTYAGLGRSIDKVVLHVSEK